MVRIEYFVVASWALAAAGLSGCSEDPALAHGTSVHESSDPDAPAPAARVSETVWTDAYEVFIDRAVPVAGEPASFAIHFTELATGQPVAVDEVTLKLTSPSGDLFSQQSKAEVKGVHSASVLLSESGDWKLVFAVSIAGGSVDVPWRDVRVFATDEAARSSALHGDPDGIPLSKEQQWAFKILIEQVERRPISSWKSYPAVVKPRTDGIAHVVPSIAGRLLAPSSGGSLPRLGDRVEAGQTLARVDPPLSGVDVMNAHANHHELETHEAELAVKTAEATAAELRSRAALELAEDALERVRGLREADAKSERELKEAEHAARVATTTYQTALAVREIYEKVRQELHAHPLHEEPILERFPPVPLAAPLAGTIDSIGARLGEYVTIDTELFVIVDTTAVYVEALVPEGDASALDAASRAFVRAGLPGRGEALRRPLETVHFGLRVDERRRVPLLYSAANDDGRLRLGMMVDVDIEIAPAAPRLAVPVSALVDDQGVPVVFVELGGEAFERRPVTTGMREEDLVEIQSGLEVGERVVTRGAYLVRLASLSSSIPGHQH